MDKYTLNGTFGVWKPGGWFSYACVDRSVSNWKNPDVSNNFGVGTGKAIDPVFGMEIKIEVEDQIPVFQRPKISLDGVQGSSRMKIEEKTKAELADEILELHRRIEQLEQSEKSAQERSEFFLEILDSLPGVITAWDSAGIHLFVNQTFVSQSGFRREDVIGKPATELYPPEEIVTIERNV